MKSATRLLPLTACAAVLLCLLFSVRGVAQEQPAAKLPAGWVQSLTWRSIGPANMGGRITALAVFEADPTTYYIATASGGLLKTVNNGITFEHQFDHEKTVSIGDVAVAPSNKNIVWVGTGESNPRNSASYGDGVYKSVDGGKSWQNMGLKLSFQIGKILIHPTNPDIVYVGAVGRLWGANPERGLFKTTDGGKTWDKILFVDDKTGVIDMRMHPTDPDTLLVATYERKRDAHDNNDPEIKWGAGSGLHKTTDGGKTFRKVSTGLPTVKLGRIGLDWYRKDPNIVYMVLESEKIGMAPKGVAVSDAYMGILGKDGPMGALLTQVIDEGPAEKAGFLVNDVVIEFAKMPVRTYDDLLKGMRAKKGGDKVEVKLKRQDKILDIEFVLGKKKDEAAKLPFTAYIGGQKENVQTQQGKEGFEYGGVYKSTDGGESWQRVNSLNPRPMYFSQIRVDPGDDRYVYVLGISLHRSADGGKTFKNDGGNGVHADQHALWIDPSDGRHMVVGCDGGFYVTYDRMAHWDHLNHLALGQFYDVALDPRPDYRVYGGLQDNGTWGGPASLRQPSGPVNADWIRIGGADGFQVQVDPTEPDLIYFTSQYGGLQRRNLATGELASIKPKEVKGKTFRYNWNTPFLLSHHDPKMYYCAGNYVFRSADRGNDAQLLSPEITRTDKGTASALSESPKNSKVLYAGTDDGYLWITRDGGKKWTNITEKVPLPGPRWVAAIEASRYVEGRAYVVFDGHRSDDDEPYVYVTEDFGQTWTSLGDKLPWGSTRVLREDLTNPDLLFLGTEFGAWCSLDRGQSWLTLNTNLPTVAVHDFALHPTSGEIVAATHGRSFWVLDISPLRSMQPKELTTSPQLFEPAPAIRWVTAPGRGGTNRSFVGTNRPAGAQIYFSLPQKEDKMSLKVVDDKDKLVRTLKAPTDAGLHRLTWDLSKETAPKDKNEKKVTLVRAVPGNYRLVLTVDGKESSQPVVVRGDPALPLDEQMREDEVRDEEEGEDEEHEAD